MTDIENRVQRHMQITGCSPEYAAGLLDSAFNLSERCGASLSGCLDHVLIDDRLAPTPTILPNPASTIAPTPTPILTTHIKNTTL